MGTIIKQVFLLYRRVNVYSDLLTSKRVLLVRLIMHVSRVFRGETTFSLDFCPFSTGLTRTGQERGLRRQSIMKDVSPVYLFPTPLLFCNPIVFLGY